MALKINERVLCGISTSNTPVDRDGWLNKKEANKQFVRRWFVLKGNLLFYFDKRKDKEPLGVIILVGYRVELDEDDNQFTFKIIFHGVQETAYVLGAESQDSMEMWMKAITCAAFDYMKLMVADLQRQIDEIEESAPQSTKEPPMVPSRDKRYNPFNNSPEPSSSKKADGKNNALDLIRKKRITFGDLHAAYGDKILLDQEEWSKYKREQSDKTEPLISL